METGIATASETAREIGTGTATATGSEIAIKTAVTIEKKTKNAMDTASIGTNGTIPEMATTEAALGMIGTEIMAEDMTEDTVGAMVVMGAVMAVEDMIVAPTTAPHIRRGGDPFYGMTWNPNLPGCQVATFRSTWPSLAHAKLTIEISGCHALIYIS